MHLHVITSAIALSLTITVCGQGNQFDSRIDSYVGLRHPCDGSVQPVLRIQNVGGETMTSCDIDILRNGLAETTFNWVLGSPAATNEFRQPALPTMAGVQPGDVLEFRILTVNGEADQGPAENIMQVPLTDEKGEAESYQVQVKVLTDDNPAETSWTIKNALGATVAQSPEYAMPGALMETPVVLSADQCYNFEVYDSGADGFGEAREMGYAKLMSMGQEVATATGAFGGLYRKVAQTGTGDGCMPTQLTSTADPAISCGAMNLILGGSTIHATEVPGANKYMFRFTSIPGQPAYARNNTSPTRSLAIGKWATLPLKKGRTYNVQVRASFDNGGTWCDFGTSCLIRVGYGVPPLQQRDADFEELPMAGMDLSLWPNPSSDGNFTLQLDGYDLEEALLIEAFDVQGARVAQMRASTPSEAGTIDVRWDHSLEQGLYLVRITHGGAVTTERLVVR